MSLKKVGSIACGLAVAGGIALAGIPAANAANWVDCAGHNDYYELIDTSGGYLCFANYGDVPTQDYSVITLSTGNNDGWVTAMTIDGVWFDSPYRGHWETGTFASSVYVGSVHIR